MVHRVHGRSTIRILDAVAAIATLAILAGWLFKTPVKADGWRRGDLNDYTLNLRHSREVDATHAYPFGFTYPPPSVLFRLGLGALGFDLGAGLWIALSGVSLIASMLLILRLLDRLHAPGAGMIALAALVLVKYPFEFEYKYLNANAMFLALVLAAVWLVDSRPRWAGLLLSLSVALKLYSVVLLPWLLLTRRFRAASWTMTFCAGWFVAVPLVTWGWPATWAITASWLQRAAETGAPDFPVRFAPNAYLVSLHAAVLAAAERFSAADAERTALWATHGLQGLWTLAVLVVLAMNRRSLNGRTRLIDASLLLLSPLPLSGQLQPHHAVVLLPAAVLVATTATDGNEPRRLRAIAAAALIAGFFLMEYGPPRPWRGFATNAAFAVYLTAVAAIKRWSRTG
jgi:hypothetical protein